MTEIMKEEVRKNVQGFKSSGYIVNKCGCGKTVIGIRKIKDFVCQECKNLTIAWQAQKDAEQKAWEKRVEEA